MMTRAIPQYLDAPKHAPDVLIIAGEHSGDAHAAKMVMDLKRLNPQVNICALGGPKLKAAGAQLLWDMTAESVVGFVEVLKYYGYFRKLFGAVLEWIEMHRPKVVLFVDYPGFNLRLAKALYQRKLAHKNGGSVHLAYYIGPQIWAWKAGRRFEMERYLEGLAVIFPFEVEAYADTQLPVTFVGHPFVEAGVQQTVKYDADGPILLLPGSRVTPVRRMVPLMLAAFEHYGHEDLGARALIVVPSKKIREVVEAELRRWPACNQRIRIVGHAEPMSGKGAWVSSGTMSLACALVESPV